MPKTRRRVRAVLGILMPGAMYDSDGAMFAGGFGEFKLLEYRRAGLLPCYEGDDGRNWYAGEDLIAVLKRRKKGIGRLQE